MKQILMTIIVMFLAVGTSWAQMNKEKALSDFISAGSFYKIGNYDDAIGDYEKILEGGWESGAIYFNLGNSYYRTDNLGKAILNYERAKRIIPRDSDLNFNYQYVQSQVRQYETPTQKFWNVPLAGLSRAYTMDEMVFMLLVAVLLLAVWHIGSLYAKLALRIRRVGLGVLLLCNLVLVGSFVMKVNQNKDLGIVIERSEAHYEPREDATTHYTLWPGNKVRFLKKEDEWIKVKRLDGKLGWVKSKKIEEI